MKISIAVTNWNRDDLTIKSFERVMHDKRVSEIIIVDDHSDIGFYKSLQFKVDRLNHDIIAAGHYKTKVYLTRNDRNLGCYHNKRAAISLANNEWVILLDSDNVIDVDYLDAIEAVFELGYLVDVILPEFARPHFDFTGFSNIPFNRSNVASLIDLRNFSTMLNAANFCVKRDVYLNNWEARPDPLTSDSLLQNYNMLKGGAWMFVCPGMQYDHLIHDGSHYKQNIKLTPVGLHDEIMQKIRELK